jgi:molecular chaperone DnaK
LNEAEIQRMVRDAEAHGAEEARRREEIEVRNQADSLHYQAEKMLREQGSSIPESVRNDVAEKSAALKRALDANDLDGMRRATQELQQAMLAVGQAAYGGGNGHDGTNGGGSSTPEGAVEGEYREV